MPLTIRMARYLALAAWAAALGGCVMGDKGVTGVFTPTTIESPPSVRSSSAAPDAAAPRATEAPAPRAARSLSVPRQAQ